MESLGKNNTIYVREAFLFFIFFIFGVLPISASHIVGGTIDYEFIQEDGNNNLYKIDLTVYADCSNSGSSTLFDYPAYIGIYRGNDNYELFDTVNVWPLQRETIDNPTFSCLVTPSNVCVKEGKYSFEIWLPRSDESYYIVYQRCCRNATISNIVNPGLSGSTYFVEITALAQSYRNSSPKFENPPPTIFCVNDTFTLNTSVIDSNGDSIVYEFCTPYLGGGTINNDIIGIFSCSGNRPNPPCPPPYIPLTFNPPYDVDAPISGNVTIDTLNGYIEGSANTLGQFVYAICAKEFRNGEYLGKVSRDFQVNTIFCPELVNATIDIALDTIRACYGTSAHFNNTSTLEDSIYSFFWTFENDNYIDTIYEWNPSISTLASGIYKSSLVLNPDHSCKDTLELFVEVYPALEPDFYFEYDSCSSNSGVAFTSQSESSYSNIEEYSWDFADMNFSTLINPIHSFEVPKAYPVVLTIKDNLECYASVTKDLSWFPLPSEISVKPKYTDPKCIPLKLEVESNFTPRVDLITGYSYSWKISDSSVTDNYSPVFDIVESGYLDLSLSMTSVNGCKLDTIFRDFVYTSPSPKSAFSYTPNEVSSINPIVIFNNESLNASYNKWYVNNELIGINENSIDYTFDIVGLQEVIIVAENEEGCLDSMIQTVDIIPDFTYFLPNAFTPNGDGKNEVFKGEGILTEVASFGMIIFDRWGSKIYETKNIANGWNGRKNNNGAILPNGAYQYIIRVVSTREKERIFKGTVILIK